MNTVEFNNWLLSNGTNKKVASDIVSRLKRIDRDLLYSESSTSVDEQFNIDSCSSLLECLSKNNRDANNIIQNSSLPVNKTEISNYKSALKKYIKYLET